jgi:hypothetical protein
MNNEDLNNDLADIQFVLAKHIEDIKELKKEIKELKEELKQLKGV